MVAHLVTDDWLDPPWMLRLELSSRLALVLAGYVILIIAARWVAVSSTLVW